MQRNQYIILHKMASSLLKSVLLFLAILQFYSSPVHGISLGPLIPKIFKLKVANIPIPAKTKAIFSRNPNPSTPRLSNQQRYPGTLQSTQVYGENLARKYFGNQFIKGFRWGYKQGKRIHSVARRCEDFTEELNYSCPKENSPLLVSAIVHCIVEVSNYFGTNETCLHSYERSQYPPEATCILDQPYTLVSNCTA
ncbi:hypothetical protein HanRHA438_Chr13g0583851 [Helianthus annuus]|nr:hypothetical protein HanRHA438_Chr13g0583851 [Helianthus annuus]